MRRLFLFAGIFSTLIANIVLVFSRYQPILLFFWLGGLVAFAFYFFYADRPKQVWRQLNKKDLLLLAALLLIFFPIYFLLSYQVPAQVNTDEVVISTVARQLTEQINPNILGISSYFGFPALTFYIFGSLANLIGGINLSNMRLLHAGAGLLIIISSYFLFRLFFNRVGAFSASLILGGSHALVGISRMAMRDNSGLLVEVASLLFLFIGLRTKNLFYSFLGGGIAGLGFYTYFPGRVVFIIWVLFLGLILLSSLKTNWKAVLAVGLANFVGFLLIVSPVLIDSYKQPDLAFTFAREQSLLYPEGRKLQQDWVVAETERKGIEVNIQRGLSVFNNKVADNGWIYPNFGHGFLDPLSGVLLWVGVIFALFEVRKRRENIFFLAALVIYLVTFSFFVNKAPNYTRLLITLPIVAFFVVKALENLATVALKRFRLKLPRFFSLSITVTIAFVILIWNLLIFGNFVKKGLREGNDVGTTGRYATAKRDLDHKFYLLASNEYPYYGWGDSNAWHEWLSFFTQKGQQVQVVDPNNLSQVVPTSPATVFMSELVFRTKAAEIENNWGNFTKTNIKSDGSLIALEME